MKKFNFRFTTLLKLREADRDQKRSELADAQRALEMIDGRIRELETEMGAARQATQSAVSVGDVEVDALLDNQRYELLLIAEKKSAETQRAEVSEETERRRAAVVDADRQVKTLEKLREKQQQRHRVTQGNYNAKQLDEAAVRSHVMRAAGE